MMVRRRSLPRAGSALMLALAFMTARLAPGSDMSTCFTHGNAMPMMHVMADGTPMQGAGMEDDADASQHHDSAPSHSGGSCCNCCVTHHAFTGLAVAYAYAQLTQQHVTPVFAQLPLYLPTNVAYIQPFATAPPVTL